MDVIENLKYELNETNEKIDKLVKKRHIIIRNIKINILIESGKMMAFCLYNHPKPQNTEEALDYANAKIQPWRRSIHRADFPKTYEFWPETLPTRWDKLAAMQYFTQLIEGLLQDISSLKISL